jgi:hypothetical protein
MLGWPSAGCGPEAAGTTRGSEETTMADSRQLRRLVAYNQWADERILTVTDGLPPEELGRPREAYFGTIAANLRHTLSAQRIWLARWKGEVARYDEAIAAPWREAYVETHQSLRGYVGGLSDGGADRVVSTRTPRDTGARSCCRTRSPTW